MSDFINLVFTQPIFNVLMLLNHLFNDFGLSIVVLTVVIRLILFPLTLQQLKSTKAMQELQPQMTALRKRYKDDQRTQAVAMQALYKEYSVNPLAGCLPLVVQFPVLYGLYFAMRAVIDDAKLQGLVPLLHLNGFIYAFLPKFSHFPNLFLDWFTFLGPHMHFSLATPDPTHILPVLAGLATFVQLRMAQPKNAAVPSSDGKDPKDPISQQMQTMKMMQYIMPLVIVFTGWTFPAGLALYWTTGSVFMLVQQYFVTGWGALLVKPNLTRKSDGDTTYTGDSKAETRVLRDVEGEDSGFTNNIGTGPIGRNVHNRTGTARRRPRGSSASARRRGGTVPRRNPSGG